MRLCVCVCLRESGAAEAGESQREKDGENLSFTTEVVWMTHEEGMIQRRTTMREE